MSNNSDYNVTIVRNNKQEDLGEFELGYISILLNHEEEAGNEFDSIIIVPLKKGEV